ncbi:hypothetical protein OIU77_031520 [Salix suchowensis]|uniref:Rieske domain-containing protein n=1 Tax=Salix suchowensis TaxID=1278906 RepID=A0ABQ9BFT1_9ROSI|nr:hypothetical protein OIU77_031520 [Salix suchowensis]
MDRANFAVFEDRCPHRLAKLSEGQLIDGRLECLYHGWQFEGGRATVSRYLSFLQMLKFLSQLVSEPMTPGFKDSSAVHELPYDHSILLENLMDPAHIPISHDRTDLSAKRENAQPLRFRGD